MKKLTLYGMGKIEEKKSPRVQWQNLVIRPPRLCIGDFFFFAEIAFNEVLRVEVQFGPN